MEDSLGIETVYKEKISMYIYYYDKDVAENDKEINIENIWEMEVMKQYFVQLEELGIEYHPVILKENDIGFFEKIYYQDSNPMIIFYNASYPIVDFGFTFSTIERAMKNLPNNFDILLFKECKDHNQIERWIEDMEYMPKLAVIRRDGIFKIIYKMWSQIQVYYSKEEVSKSIYAKWEDYFLGKFENILDWFGETIYSI